MIEEAYEKEHEFKLVELTEVDESEMLCILAGVGGGVPQEAREKVAPYYEKINLGENARLIRLKESAKELSEYINHDFFQLYC